MNKVIQKLNYFFYHYNSFFAMATICLLGIMAYTNSLQGQFLWDDGLLIKNNVFIKHWFHFPKLFIYDIAAGAGAQFGFHRPLLMVTLLFDYTFWKDNPFGYHLTTIALHLYATLLIYWFVRLLFRDGRIAFFTGILFVLHPVHVEDVAYITGRADSLALSFMLLSFIFYLRQNENKNTVNYIIMVVSFLGALFSKEASIILPGLVLVYHFSLKRKIGIFSFITLMGIAFIYTVFRFTFLTSSIPLHTVTSTMWQRIPGFFVAVTNYTCHLLLPINLYMGYDQQLFRIIDPKAIMGIIIVCSLLILIFKIKNRSPIIFFSIAWFFVSLLPVSNVIYPASEYMADRYLYIPSFGFVLLAAHGIVSSYKRWHRKGIALSLFFGLVFIYTFTTIKQNEYWREPIAFYTRSLHYNPYNARLYSGLADSFYEGKDFKKAIIFYQKSLLINPSLAFSNNNLGALYYEQGEFKQALVFLKRALQIKPTLSIAHYNLGKVYDKLGKYDLASVSYQEALTYNPFLVQAYNNLATLNYKVGKYNKALQLYKKAIAIDPAFEEGYINLGSFLANLNYRNEAHAYFNKVLYVNPGNSKAYYCLAKLYFLEENYPKAIVCYDRANRLGYSDDIELGALLSTYRK